MLGKLMAANSGNVTKFLLVALILFLLAPMVVILCLGTPPEPAPGGGGEPNPPTTTGRTEPQPRSEVVPAAGASTVATRALAAEAPSTEGLAEAPSACLRVVDHASQAPVAGAALRRVQGGAEIAFTDDRGLASVPLLQPEQLAVVMDGYLLRMAPTQIGSTEAQPQQVQLVRDVWSVVRRFEFFDPDGRSASVAFVRFRPRAQQAGVAASAPLGPSAADKLVQRAWQEHTMLGGLPVCADVPVQVGVWSQDRVHRVAHRGEVRFAAPGEFLAEVATESGLVGTATFRIETAAAGASAQTIRVNLERGDFLAGSVVAIGSMRPVVGVQITLQGGEPLGLLATTGADGSFRIGPLARGEVTLHLRHGDHQPLSWGPVVTNGNTLRIPMQPLPSTTLRGRVRGRPDQKPIAGARLAWLPTGGNSVTAVTDADGTFQIAATGDAASRLAISAAGFLNYAELVQPGAPFAEYDLWPADPAVRLAKGMSARLVGVVVDAGGTPQQQVAVRWIPDRPNEVAGVVGRRILEGGSLALPLIVSTGVDGSFQLETNQFGPGHLALAEAGPSAAGGVAVTAVAGSTKDGLRLQR